MKDRVSAAIGYMCLLWPLTIPGRIILVTWKRSKKLLCPTTAIFRSDGLYLRTNEGSGTRFPWQWTRKYWEFGDIFVFEGKVLQFVMVRKSAFTPEQQFQIRNLVQSQLSTKN